MENKILNDKELEKVVAGWSDDAPDTIKFCPECGGPTTGGIVTGRNPTRGMICCKLCDFEFEVYLDGPNAGQLTGVSYHVNAINNK